MDHTLDDHYLDTFDHSLDHHDASHYADLYHHMYGDHQMPDEHHMMHDDHHEEHYGLFDHPVLDHHYETAHQDAHHGFYTHAVQSHLGDFGPYEHLGHFSAPHHHITDVLTHHEDEYPYFHEHYGHNPTDYQLEEAYYLSHYPTPAELGYNPVHHSDDSFSHDPNHHYAAGIAPDLAHHVRVPHPEHMPEHIPFPGPPEHQIAYHTDGFYGPPSTFHITDHYKEVAASHHDFDYNKAKEESADN